MVPMGDLYRTFSMDLFQLDLIDVWWEVDNKLKLTFEHNLKNILRFLKCLRSARPACIFMAHRQSLYFCLVCQQHHNIGKFKPKTKKLLVMVSCL